MKTKQISTSTACMLALLLASSCMTMEPKREDVLDKYTPEKFSTDNGITKLQTKWWHAFESAQLNRLMDESFSGNLTLEQAAARIEQYEATARKSGATSKLELDLTASGSSKHYDYKDIANTSTTANDIGLYASYELDMWGRLKSTQKVALANWESSKFDMQTAAMTLSAELADSYLVWLAQTKALAIYESQLKSNRNMLKAIERRYKTGQATKLDLLQQRQKVAAAETTLPPVRTLINASENKIAVLIGKIPGTDLKLTQEPIPTLPPQPSTGLPISLLENRPDIQAARLNLESADWAVSASRAARLPTISLSGNVSTSSEKIADLFDDWASNLAANLLAPLLDGGLRKAEIDRTMAVSREKIAAYRLTVLEAIQETENALNGEIYQAEYVKSLAKQYTASQKSETESIHRYQRGILAYTDTLTVIVSRESLEIKYLQAQTDLLSNRIQLYRSLGGDWTFIMEEK